MIEEIKKHIAEAQEFQATTLEQVEQFRIKVLGSKGLLKDYFAKFKTVPNEQKKEFGQTINAWKSAAEAKVAELKESLQDNKASESQWGDLTRPSMPLELGSRHPISLVKNQIIDVFSRVGFNVSEGPEIEDDWHNFTALNLPEYIQHVICRILSLFKRIQMCYCARIHRLFRYVTWKKTNRQLELFLLGVYFVTKIFRHVRTVFFTK